MLQCKPRGYFRCNLPHIEVHISMWASQHDALCRVHWLPNPLSCAIFYLFLLFWPLFDFNIFSLLLSSVFCLQSPTLSYNFPNPLSFCFPSSILHLYFNSSFTYFRIPYSTLCSFVPFLLLSFHHLSIIPCLPFLTLTT